MASRKPPSQRNPEYATARMARAIQSMAPGTMSGRMANASPIDFRSGSSIPVLGGGSAGGSGYVPAPRVVTTFTTRDGLVNNETEMGAVELSTHYRILKLKTNAPARVRLYTTFADRDADYSRPILYDPDPGRGLVMDYLTADVLLEAPLAPIPEGVIFDAAQGTRVPWNVTSVNGGRVTVTLTWVALE